MTFDDPGTWTAPWTFAMNLTRTTERPFEYAAMFNLLSIARADEAQAAVRVCPSCARPTGDRCRAPAGPSNTGDLPHRLDG